LPQDKWSAPKYLIYGTSVEEGKIVNINFYQIPIFGRALFLKLPHALPLCISVNTLFRCRRVWRFGGMILTGGEQKYPDKGCPNATGFYLTENR
jgi:hypothetical protein